MKYIYLMISLLLVACGGGGDSAPAPTPVVQPMTVYTIGDSETAGFTPCSTPPYACYTPEHSYPTYLQTFLPANFKVHDISKAGTTALDMLRDQLPQAVAGKANYVVIMNGVYDDNHSVGLNDYYNANSAMVQQLKQIGAKIIILGPIWPHHDAGQIFLADFAAAGQRIANEQGQTFIDLKAADQPTWWACADASNFHPCPEGYKAIGKIVADKIATLK
ncbi:SGNH/GDSL hydrolase family protein [Chitinimonas naiadis]